MTAVATVNTRRGHADVVDFSSVVITGRQELNKKDDRDEVQRSLPRTGHYSPSTSWAARLMVSWDIDHATVVPSSEWAHLLTGAAAPDVVDKLGVAWRAHGGRVLVSPARGVIGTCLEVADVGRVVFLNTHMVSSAWSKRRVVGKKWRRRQWRKHKQLLDHLTAALTAAGFLVVLVGDFNYGLVLSFPGLKSAGGGDRPGYDQIHASPDLMPRRFRRADGADKHQSDHYPRAADIGPKEDVMPTPDYRPANATVQWFANAYPGSRINPNVCVLHTTETSGWPGYVGGATAPTYTARPAPAKKKLEWRQHFPETMSARALRNEPGGVETNTLNAVQVELIGTCAPGVRDQWVRAGLREGIDFIFWPDAPDWALKELGDFLAHLHNTRGIKLQAPEFLPYPASYGDSSVRFTGAAWSRFYGVCGHQHVPENDHGDPGALNIEKVIRFALGDTYPTDPKHEKPTRVQRAHVLEEEIRADLRQVAKKFEELDALLADVPEARSAVARWRTAIDESGDGIKQLRQQLWADAKKAPEK